MLVVVLGFVAVWMGFSAHDARNDAKKAASGAGMSNSMPGMDMSAGATGSSELTSYAGQAPANADALAKRHVPMNATPPPAPAGPVARVHLVLVDKTIEIAPGVKYSSWTFSGGATVRFWVVDAGPSFDTDFHVVGTILNRAWVNADMTQYQRNVQTALVPAGGGGVFDVKVDQPGLYPFVSHSFAAVDLGQVGLLNVGGVKGSMSH
jgi:hypothetical protein